LSGVKLSTLTNASIVTGTLRGLSEGIGYWKAGEITDDMLARLQSALADLHEKARAVSDAVLASMEAQPCCEPDTAPLRKLVLGELRSVFKRLIVTLYCHRIMGARVVQTLIDTFGLREA
jgi:hypothetical protein